MKFSHLIRIIPITSMIILGACAGAPAAPAATDVPAQSTAAAAVQPTAAFEDVTDVEPTIGAIAADGSLAWRDQILRNDAVAVSIKGLTALPDGDVYAAWLANSDNSLPLGALTTSENGNITLTFDSPDQQNLLGSFERVFITKGAQADATNKPTTVVLGGALPEQALAPIREILVAAEATPGKIGYALGLRQETDELLRHAQFLRDAYQAGDFNLEKIHAEHIINIIRGSEARDANGDGKIQNPGDGFGLLPNGQQDGYIKGMADQAKRAADSPDATAAIKLHAGHVQVTAENTRQRVDDVRALAEQIIPATGLEATEQSVLGILSLAEQAIQGVDVDLDEQVGPIPGEGGVITAYQHAQLMASVPLAPQDAAITIPNPVVPTSEPAAQPAPTAEGQNAPAPAPAPKAKAFAVSVGDNSFNAKKLTIPVGATVTWKNDGKRPHTVTADDGSFVSGNMDAGATFSQTFTKPGTYPYYCEYHGAAGGTGMAGTIIVTDGSAAAKPPQAPAAPKPTTQPAPPAPANAATTVEVGDNTFNQKEISVAVGTTVTWKSTGQKPHTVTADDGSFVSGTLKNGDTFTYTFDKPGTYAYYCEFHGGAGGQGMAGVIKVGDATPASAAAPAAPATAPTAAPPAVSAPFTMVDIGDNTFNQKEISIPVGGSVMWMSSGQKPHTVTADDGSFTSETLKTGDMYTHVFDKPGIYPYYCKFHGAAGGQGMSGVVKVGDVAQAAPPAPAAAPAAAQPSVSMKDFAFEPAEIHVKVGQSITWKNDGEKRHSASAVDGSFDTGLFGKGESKTVQFNNAGTFRYFCQLHGAPDGSTGMVATVIVDP